MCSAEANPAAKYRLYKGDKIIANITAGSQNIGLYGTSVSDRVKEVVYKCIPFNSFGDGPTKELSVTLHYPVEATGAGTNTTVAEGAVKSLSCPVDGNPEPNIKWYKGSEARGKPLSVEKVLTVEGVRESVCYTCVAGNSLGTPVSIFHSLVIG
ncbi:PREDICTED: tyrosine-protein phosphatase Lar-like [Acropora digitifera]|uniref:tyrosine-protein phosphatase Lar-like n=1 Tax=Acropora digitifera TaxID=70779 RepID=UPI00077A9E35|nr:PREDICTED: tyrosine-protein phosphatase Lar-like [Acropora digitifera]